MERRIRKNKILVVLFVINFICLSLSSQNGITYNEFITTIKNNHPLIERAQNISIQGNYLVNAARGSYDPTINSNYENKFFNSKNYFSLLHAEVKQPIFTNQYITAGYDYGQGNFLDPSDVTSPTGTPYIGVEASILQGLLFDKRRAEVLKAKEYKKYYEAEKNQLVNQLLFEASGHFAEWSFAEKELHLYEYFLNLANNRYAALVVLSNIGEKAAVDTIEASLLYQSRFLEYQSVKLDNQKMQNKVLTFSWKDELNPMIYDTSLIIKDSLEFYFKQAESLAANEMQLGDWVNPTITKYSAIQNIVGIEKRLKGELIKPKLDVKYNFLPSNANPYFTDYSTSNYKWGAKFSMPLFLRSSRNEFKIAKLNYKNSGYELTNKQNEIELKMKLINQAIFILRDQVSFAEKNVRYSKQLLEAEKLKFESGESSLFLLNTRETKWLESELKLAEYRTKFIKAVFELVYVKGSINYKL